MSHWTRLIQLPASLGKRQPADGHIIRLRSPWCFLCVLCDLCGRKLLTAKDAKDAKKCLNPDDRHQFFHRVRALVQRGLFFGSQLDLDDLLDSLGA